MIPRSDIPRANAITKNRQMLSLLKLSEPQRFLAIKGSNPCRVELAMLNLFFQTHKWVMKLSAMELLNSVLELTAMYFANVNLNPKSLVWRSVQIEVDTSSGPIERRWNKQCTFWKADRCNKSWSHTRFPDRNKVALLGQMVKKRAWSLPEYHWYFLCPFACAASRGCSLKHVLLLKFLRVVVGDSECNSLFQIVRCLAG